MTQPLFLSVVVPTCSRVPALRVLLDHLRPSRQRLDAEAYEIIVSDDAVVNPAASVLQREFPAVRFVTGPGRGPAANRNSGARHARGQWLVFVDDDCQPADGWLRAIASAIGSQPLDVVEGKIVAPDRRASLFRRDVENLHGDCFWSANLAIRREYFDAIGGFDEDFAQAGGEDLELAYRFRTRHARTVFCRDAIVSHPSHVMSWAALLEFNFRMRWHALYLLKTGQTLPADAPMWKTAGHVAASRTIALLRTSVQRLRLARRQPAVLAGVAFDWVVFPVLLPNVVFWHLRFARTLRSRHAAPSSIADNTITEWR